MTRREPLSVLLLGILSACATLPPSRAEIASKASDINSQLTKVVTTLDTRAEESVPYSSVEQYVVAALADAESAESISATRVATTARQPRGKPAGWAHTAATECRATIDLRRRGWGTQPKLVEIQNWKDARDVCLHVSEFEDIFKNPTGAK